MHRRFAIFCKSFRDDFARLENLIESWKIHSSGIPLLISVPKSDIGLLHDSIDIPMGVWVISDESYIREKERSPYGWMFQQICKLAIGRTNFADSYYLIDSDSYFLRDLTSNEFINGNGALKIVANPMSTRYSSSNPMLSNYLNGKIEAPRAEVKSRMNHNDFMNNLRSIRDIHRKFPERIAGERRQYISQVFDEYETGALGGLNWGPNPVFHTEILTQLEFDITRNGMTWRDLIYLSPWEYEWYAFYAIKRFEGKITPTLSSCVHFAGEEDVLHARDNNISHSTLENRFVAVAMASRHFQLQQF